MDKTTALLLASLLVPSLAGYALVLRRLIRRGGAVSTKYFGGPELMVTVVLASFFGFTAFAGFFSHPEAHKLTGRDVETSSLFELGIVAGMALFVVLRGASLSEVFGLRRQPLWRAAGYAIGLMLLAFPLVVAVANLVAGQLPKDVSEEQQIVSLFREGLKLHRYGAIAQIVLTAAVVAPLVEEFIFRGYFYPVLKRYFGASGSAVLTAVLFALLHVNVASLGSLFLLALCFTVAYEWTGSLLVPIGMHALFNSSELALLCLSATSSS